MNYDAPNMTKGATGQKGQKPPAPGITKWDRGAAEVSDARKEP